MNDYFKDHVDLVAYRDEDGIIWCAEAPFGSGLEHSDDITVKEGDCVIDAVVESVICVKRQSEEYAFVKTLMLNGDEEFPKVRSVVAHKFFVYADREQEKSNDNSRMDQNSQMPNGE